MKHQSSPGFLRLQRVLAQQTTQNGSTLEYTALLPPEGADNIYHADANESLSCQRESVLAFLSSERFRHIDRAYNVEQVVHCQQPACSDEQRLSSERLYTLQCDNAGIAGLNSVGVSDTLQVLLASRHCQWMFITPWPLNDSGVRKCNNSVEECQDILTKIKGSQSRFGEERAQISRRSGGAVRTQASRLMETIDLDVPFVCKGAAEGDSLIQVARNVRKLIAAGAAGVYVNDRVAENVKFQVKVQEAAVVPSKIFLSKLRAARFVSDCLQSPLVLIGKTLLSEAQWIISMEDSRDHVFLLGSSHVDAPRYDLQSGKRKQQQWQKSVQPTTFVKLIASQQVSPDDVEQWGAFSAQRPSQGAMRELACSLLGSDNVPSFDVECCRDDRGYFMVDQESFLKARMLDQVKVADVIWVPYSQSVTPKFQIFREMVQEYPFVKFLHSYPVSIHRGLGGLSEAEEKIQQNAQIKANGVLHLLPEGTLLASVLGQDVMLRTLREHGAATTLRLIQERTPQHLVQNQQTQ